jgi:hypothetical protein
MRPADNMEKLIKKLRYKASAETHDRVLGNVMQVLDERQKQKAGVIKPDLWRMIMKNTFTKIAVAAVTIIAVLIGINPFGGTITFAEVVEPILNAKTVVLDLIIGSDESGPTVHDIVAGSRMRRSFSNMPALVQIIDLESARMLALDTAGKTAGYVDIQGPIRDQTQNYVEFLRQIIRQLQDGRVEEIGEQVIDGQKAIGFVGRGQNEAVTIWADPKTAHPIRIELELGQISVILKNFEFDGPVDKALLSMDVPAGYTLDETEFDLTDATEQDFIESLRVWAEVMRDGTFPDAIGTENAMKQMPLLGEKIATSNLPEDQASRLAESFGKGMLFHQMLDIGGGDWHYAGAGIKLGDGDEPIFWYQPQDSETWRVIYGDLSIRDVAPENLPK